ncbi:PEP-utilizing enzyme [Shimazuella sp. AN120528]|uniref:PEP/pyruvate-binding domain-containing protein n=1 Tax=Shimazuella soli TaxID=1892854 RepID=UPI001F10C2F9|nr:PEP/pyruvate-binding domain-containing protein [Shimazuella soli]MCH5583866.1 PEP-utilizing enzyme [Shimazuella soli]
MSRHVKTFADLTSADFSFAGGKGMMLAKMRQDGYPVPDGFVILSTATGSDNLDDDVWTEVVTHLNKIRNRYPQAKFAVRSSALSEDSSEASFAGEFDTVLNQSTDEEIKEAVQTVIHSVHHERVKTYSSIKGMGEYHQIAVVIQVMVPSQISGVLFTADPVTGSSASMIGNFVYGLGEQLVSGETDAYTFELTRIRKKYNGPNEMKKYASQLYDLAVKLEKQFGLPQDLEWAVANEKLYILQARPITTLSKGNLDSYDINYSLSGDYLWTNANVGEAVPDVVTPFTWSILQYLDKEISVVPGYYLMSGNICGRIYTNISRRLSVFSAFGINPKFALSLIGDVFGNIPQEMELPIYPFTRWELLKLMVPKVKHYLKEVQIASKSIKKQISDTPQWCQNMKKQILAATTTAELKNIWDDELHPYHRKAWLTLLSGGTKAVLAMRLKKKLAKMVGEEDANALLSNLRGKGELASLGPILGISKVLAGEMSKEEYAFQYGHRSPYEFELSIADPAENSDWLEGQIKDFHQSNINVMELLTTQEARSKAAFVRFEQKYPLKKRWLKEQLNLAAEGAQLRETVRSEFVRVHRVLRTFMLQAGEVTGIKEDIFFLYLPEIEGLLSGEENITKFIPKRKETYAKFKSLPPFPAIIRGRFDPFTWVNDPKRRGDIYDPTIPYTETDTEELKGFAGAAGRIEGIVRVLRSPDQGKELKVGEILVASSTNVGWTPLFPKAAAIITDVGAPLSHAAIVARELGIPAVVGCGNATTRLRTGDRVIVDGGQGLVHIIEK